MQADKDIFKTAIRISEQQYKKLSEAQRLAEEKLQNLFAEKDNSLTGEGELNDKI